MTVSVSEILECNFSGEWGEDSMSPKDTKVIRTTNFTNEGILDLSNVVLRSISQKKITEKKLKYGDTIIEISQQFFCKLVFPKPTFC